MNCYDAHKNLYMEVREGQLHIAPCCIMPTTRVDNVDFYNNKYLTDIRNTWNSGNWPTECNTCYRNEIQGNISRRISVNQWFTDHHINDYETDLIRLDFWVGDTCNLKCLICSPKYSSAWQQELKSHIPIKKRSLNTKWDQLDLSKIKFIHFTGGEPLLDKSHEELLAAIPKPERVKLLYNTNATIIPRTELVELWKKFNLVEIYFSIDDIEQRFEHQRFPAKWSTVLTVLDWFYLNSPVNSVFGITTSVGLLNEHSVEDLKSWVKNNFYQNRLGDPVSHVIQLTNGMLSLDQDCSPEEIAEYLDQCDQRRGTNWRELYPQLTLIKKI